MDLIEKRDDILYLLKSIDKHLKEGFNKRLESYGLTGHQGRILLYIIRSTIDGNQVHQIDIEKQFNYSKSTVSEFVNRMISKGFLTKEIDKPYAVLIPTEKSYSLEKLLDKSRKEILNKLTTNISNDDKEKLLEILNKILINIKEEA